MTGISVWLEQGLQWLALARQELLLFAGAGIVLGAVDETVIDFTWAWLRLRGRGKSGRWPAALTQAPLGGTAAVLVPAWQEAAVIGATVSHMLRVWPQRDYVVYVGCYRNDPATLAAATAAGAGDDRLRVVVIDVDGPTTKADCLNRLYTRLCEDERANDRPYRILVLHDAEDMVHPAGLAAIDAGLMDADFVQLPVRPELQSNARWIAGHYADEFAEAHGKELVVRDALGAAIPAAGVGCGFSRGIVAAFAASRGGGNGAPFAAECLTEDYEMGMLTARLGGRSRFLRLRGDDGQLIATRCYFPDSFRPAWRQKARWLHGIAFQGWDRLGWSRRPIDNWMALRDRRGPLAVLVLTAGYLAFILEGLLQLALWLGHSIPPLSSPVATVATICGYILIWRCLIRSIFTAREYGWREGLRSIPRTVVATIVAIVSGRAALAAYLRSLCGGRVVWDKTEHHRHPALSAQ